MITPGSSGGWGQAAFRQPLGGSRTGRCARPRATVRARRGVSRLGAERAAAPGVHEEGLVRAAAELDHGLAQEGPAIGGARGRGP